ncbi:MAG TPA: LytR C-terminal domain-containing protein [Longimicrobium sp.]|nr:LytR C-terminal domain-containing protein [Longimicrobium sp.]
MPRSKPKRGSASASRGKGGTGGRLQTLALFVTIAAVGALLASLGYGVWQHFNPPAPTPAVAAEPARPASPAQAPSERIRVEVLNATRTPGLARTGRDLLRDRGYDVVSTGNAQGFSADSSLVLDRVGNLEQARGVAGALGIGRVESRRDPNLVLEVTVVLGSDWRAPPEGASRP